MSIWQWTTCTEKLWRTLQTQTVPVVMGGGNYFRDAPERVFCSFPIFWNKGCELEIFTCLWLGFADIYWIITPKKDSECLQNTIKDMWIS